MAWTIQQLRDFNNNYINTNATSSIKGSQLNQFNNEVVNYLDTNIPTDMWLSGDTISYLNDNYYDKSDTDDFVDSKLNITNGTTTILHGIITTNSGGGSEAKMGIQFTHNDPQGVIVEYTPDFFNIRNNSGSAPYWKGITFNGDIIRLIVNDAPNYNSITINETQTTSTKPIRYTSDLSGSYNANTLVQKSYVDNNYLSLNGGGTVEGDVTVIGSVVVSGSTFFANTQHLNVSDNLLLINSGQTGNGVTAGFAGLEVDRGNLTNYQLIFDELSDSFKIGEVGDLQIVATRQDSPTDGHLVTWNSSENRFDTTLNPANYVVNSDLNSYYTSGQTDAAISDALSTIDLSDYSVTGHTHDDRYYTESEVDTLLSSVGFSPENTIILTSGGTDKIYEALSIAGDDDLILIFPGVYTETTFYQVPSNVSPNRKIMIHCFDGVVINQNVVNGKGLLFFDNTTNDIHSIRITGNAVFNVGFNDGLIYFKGSTKTAGSVHIEGYSVNYFLIQLRKKHQYNVF